MARYGRKVKYRRPLSAGAKIGIAVAAVAVIVVLGVYFRCQLKPEKKVTYGKMPQRRAYKKKK